MGMCPLLKKETIEKEPCDSKGYTHTASILVVFTLRKPVPLLGGVSSQPVQQAHLEPVLEYTLYNQLTYGIYYTTHL